MFGRLVAPVVEALQPASGVDGKSQPAKNCRSKDGFHFHGLVSFKFKIGVEFRL